MVWIWSRQTYFFMLSLSRYAAYQVVNRRLCTLVLIPASKVKEAVILVLKWFLSLAKLSLCRSILFWDGYFMAFQWIHFLNDITTLTFLFHFEYSSLVLHIKSVFLCTFVAMGFIYQRQMWTQVVQMSSYLRKVKLNLLSTLFGYKIYISEIDIFFLYFSWFMP